jgi:hypothetical protein
MLNIVPHIRLGQRAIFSDLAGLIFSGPGNGALVAVSPVACRPCDAVRFGQSSIGPRWSGRILTRRICAWRGRFLRANQR